MKFENLYITKEKFEKICSIIKKIESLKVVSFSKILIENSTLQSLNYALKERKTSLSINFQENNFIEKDLYSFLANLKEDKILSKNLISLNLIENHVNSHLLLNLFPFLSNLLQINLSNNLISHQNIKELFSSFSTSKKIRKIVLKKCNISNTSCNEICSFLNKNKSLLKLDLENNLIDDEGGKIILNSLINNLSINKVNFKKNNFSSKFSEDFLEKLRNHTFLKKISIFEENLTKETPNVSYTECDSILKGVSSYKPINCLVINPKWSTERCLENKNKIENDKEKKILKVLENLKYDNKILKSDCSNFLKKSSHEIVKTSKENLNFHKRSLSQNINNGKNFLLSESISSQKQNIFDDIFSKINENSKKINFNNN